jgi:hypothetical protein
MRSIPLHTISRTCASFEHFESFKWMQINVP